MESPYKVKHWSPVKRVPKAYDPYWNVIEWENIEADEYSDDKGNIKGVDSVQLPFFVPLLWKIKFFIFFCCVGVEMRKSNKSYPGTIYRNETPPMVSIPFTQTYCGN